MGLLGLAAAFAVGGSIYDRSKQASEDARYRKWARKQARTEIGLLRKQKAEFEGLYKQRRGYITDLYGNEVRSLTSKLQNTLYDIGTQKGSAERQSGLAYSGTINTMSNRATDVSGRDYDINRESLFTKLQSSLLESTMSERREIGAIESQIESLKGQFKMNQPRIPDFMSGILEKYGHPDFVLDSEYGG